MATIVIIPAATHGGWRWKEVRLGLQAAGHEVYALTLTGLGERSHLATPDIGVDTHIQDVVNVLEYEDLRDVVLVGHSYGGAVITGVADRVADRLARIIYVDAVLPRDGECAFDVLSPQLRASWEAQARLDGEGWRVPPSNSPDWRDAPQPLKANQQPLRLTGTGSDTVPGAYVRCTVKPNGDEFALSADRARERGWPVYDLATGHSPLANEAARGALLDLLLNIV